MRFPRDQESEQSIVFVEARYKHVKIKIQHLGSRPYTPEVSHVILDHQRTDHTIANKKTQMNRPASSVTFNILGNRSLNQEGTQKCYSHHQTRSRGNLRGCSTGSDDVGIIIGDINNSWGRSRINGIGREGPTSRIETNRIAGCIAGTSGTRTATKVLARARHSCRVCAS